MTSELPLAKESGISEQRVLRFVQPFSPLLELFRPNNRLSDPLTSRQRFAGLSALHTDGTLTRHSCDVFHVSPGEVRASRLLTADVAEEAFLRDLYQTYADVPRTRFRHLAKTERNGEIVRRHEEGETLAALARRFAISEPRVWRIIQRYG